MFEQNSDDEQIHDESTSIKGEAKSENGSFNSESKATENNEGSVHCSYETTSHSKEDHFGTEELLKIENELIQQEPVVKESEAIKPVTVKVEKKPAKKPMALRKDVVNKTVVRSLKRYITQKFEDMTKLTEIQTKKEKLEKFEELTQSFTFNLFGSKINEYNEDGLSQDDLVFIVRMLIQPDLVKKMNKTREQRFLCNNYYDCIYKYSHKRLLKLIKNPTLSHLFEDFIRNGCFEQLVMEDETLKRNPEAYIEAAQNLLALFRH